MSPQLVGKPHWPLTRYEKIWGFWQFAGRALGIGVGLIFGPLIFFSFTSWPGKIDPVSPLAFLSFLPVFGLVFTCLGLIGISDWWQLIHGTVPDPNPLQVILHRLVDSPNEQDPWKEHAELQARLNEIRGKETKHE